MIKEWLRNTPVYDFVLAWRRRRAIEKWNKAGQPMPPPPAVKQAIVADYQSRHELRALVETGTYLGDMIAAQRRRFDKIYSIELNETLHERAKLRFAGYPHIVLLQGDSGQVLPTILQDLPPRTLFWLDGHWSGGPTSRGNKATPIVAELETVLTRANKLDVILIDDARCFDGTDDYPDIEEVKRIILERCPNAQINVEHDVLRAVIGANDGDR